MPAKKYVVRNLSIYLLSFTSSVIGVILNFYLARQLGAESYGRLQYLVALATTLSSFFLLGLNTLLIREANNPKNLNHIFSKCLSVYSLVAVFSAPIMHYVLINHLPNTSGSFVTTAIVIGVALLMGVDTLVASYYQGVGNYRKTVVFENFLPKLLLLIASICFVALNQAKLLETFYLLLYLVIYGVIAVPFLIRLFKGFDFSLSREEWASVFFFFGVTITYSLGNNLTKVLHGSLYRNDVALAIVSVSLSIVSLIRVFTGVLDNLVKPIFAQKKRENDSTGLLDIYRFDTRVNSYISIPLYLFFAIHSERFLSVFGNDYCEYPTILLIIAAANAVSDLTGPNGTMLAMTGKEKWELFNGFLYFGAYFAGVFVFSFDPIHGLSLALLGGQIIVNTAKYVEVWVFYRVNPLDLKTFFSMLIIFAVDFGVVFALRFLSVGLWPWIAIGIGVGALLVLGNFFLLSLFRKEDFKRLLALRL